MLLIDSSLLKKVAVKVPLFIGVLILLYTYLPLCVSERYVFPTQTQVVVMLAYFTVIVAFYGLSKLLFHLQVINFSCSTIDKVACLCLLYLVIRNVYFCNVIEFELLLQYFSIVILFLFFRSISTKQIIYLLLLFPVVGIFQIYYGVKNQANNFSPGYGLSDVVGIFNNSGIFGGFIAIVLVITFGLVFYKTQNPVVKHRWLLSVIKLFAVLLLFLFLIQLIKTNSRASWLAVIAGITFFVGSYYGFFRYISELSNVRKWVFAVITSVLLGGLIVGLYYLKKDSADGRILIWRVSMEMIKDKPLFGHGINGFQANYMDYQANYFKIHPNSIYGRLADDNMYAFNEGILIFVEQGLIGFTLNMLLLYVAFFSQTKTFKHWKVSILRAALLSLFTFSLFSYPMVFTQFQLMLVLFFALISSLSAYDNYFITSRIIRAINLKKRLRVFISIIVFIIGTFTLSRMTFVIRNYEIATKKWNEALFRFNSRDTVNSIELLKSTYPLLKNSGVYLSTYGTVLFKSSRFTEALPILRKANSYFSSAQNLILLGQCYQALGEYNTAVINWNNASYMIPSAFMPHYLKAKMYFQTGEKKEAKQIANYLLRKEVKVRSPELYEMLLEMDSIVHSK